MTGKQERKSLCGIWRNKGEGSVLKEAGTQAVKVYIDRVQATVALWVSLRPIFEACAQQETCYEGGRWRRPLWWRQTAADVQLRVTLEDIL